MKHRKRKEVLTKMTNVIKGIKNERPFYYFEEISKIPRGSGNEKEIANYIVDFAKKHNLPAYIDEANNVLITKNATQGRENDLGVMLQAHTDMVCEKDLATKHDFSSEPIALIQEGNILRANGTTLGADDGFGVAIMLAILENDEISHPYIECLFTSSEEIGLVGAGKFDYTKIKAKQMINLDSAEENTVIIGCCGGVRTEMTLSCTREENTSDAYKITIGGLCGGHSGEDIDKGRLNAHILMGKVLMLIKEITDFKISYISGGDKDNAIPRECECIIVPNASFDDKIEEIKKIILNKVVAKEDENLTINIEKTDTSSTFSSKDTEKMLKLLSIPNAVLKYRDVAPILPSISRNLARIRTEESNIKIGFSSRSYTKEGLDFSTDELESLASKIDASYYHHERYPSWQDEADSPLVTKWQKAYNKATGKTTVPTLIHAGLECGLITSNVKGLSAISVGANVHDLHTPRETMEIDSMDRIYDTVCTFLSK
ncbi:MAG: beta-Ala-His dipeptidase [Clostridia bacterium]|nr:beta-Ala-His dipeptidase [Clostridia bacterium]